MHLYISPSNKDNVSSIQLLTALILHTSFRYFGFTIFRIMFIYIYNMQQQKLTVLILKSNMSK